MPIYEYRCEKGHTFDVVQRMVDDPLSACEVCGASAVRVLHAPAVHFKGSGFYNTDYGTKKRAREKSAESSATSSGESKSSDAKSSDSAATDTKKSDGGSDKKAKPTAA